MIAQREISREFTRIATHYGELIPSQTQSCTLEIVVIFSDVPSTLKALQTAAELAHNLNGRRRILAIQVVPYPLSLEHPPISQDFNQKRFRTMASQGSIDTRAEVWLWRDRDDALRLLPPESLIVIGTQRSWWPKTETILIRKLHKKGHHVILAYPERKNA